MDIDTDEMGPLEALKLAYRKHVREDEDIGWDELGDVLRDVLAAEMGSAEFHEWDHRLDGGTTAADV